MYSEGGFTVCDTGRRSRIFYAKCLNLSASTGPWLVCPSFGLVFLPITLFCVGWWFSDLSRYLQTINPWMRPAGKKDEDRKGLATATSQFRFRKRTGWIRVSRITGLMPGLRHLWACLFPAAQHDSLIQASPPNASKSLDFVTLCLGVKFPLPPKMVTFTGKLTRAEGERKYSILPATEEGKQEFFLLTLGHHDSLSGLSVWVVSAWFLHASPSTWSTWVWSRPVIFSVACWYFTGNCI